MHTASQTTSAEQHLGQTKSKTICTLVEEIYSTNSTSPPHVPLEAFCSCELNLAENYLNWKKKLLKYIHKVVLYF